MVFKKPASQICNFQKFEIIFLTKLESISIFLIKTEFKNSLTHPTKFGEGKTEGKIRKKENDRFLISG
jgi:hypothetical protein